MRRFLLIALCLPAIAAAQGVRFDQYNMTSASNVPFGAQAPIYTLPNSTVTVCAYPDDGGQPCGNVIPIYSDPALTQLADNAITADVHGRFGFWLAPGTYTYSVVTQGGVFVGTYIFTLGGSGGGGGCSTGGIATTNGTVTGDNTSTNCGYHNRVGDTAGANANVQTFGYQNGTNNSSTFSVFVGNGNGVNAAGVDIVGIGDTVLGNSTGGFGSTIAIGNGPANNIINGGSNLILLGQGAGSWLNNPGDVIAIGNGAAAGQTGLLGALTVSVFLGDGAGAHASGGNIIGIGNGGGAQYLPGTSDVVGIGNGAASGPISGSTFLPTASPHDVVGIGNGAAGKNAANEVIAIGQGALNSATGNTGLDNNAIGRLALTANTTGSANTVFGSYAGANGWVNRFSVGNSNVTGQNNTWLGYDAGPNVTTQLTNSIAVGYQAHNTASNQIVVGNSSTTEAHIFGTNFTPASSSAACTVPQTAYDASFAYFCTATNTWKRVALSSF